MLWFDTTYFLDHGVAVPPLWVGQVSIAGSAVATLQKELSSSSATVRNIIKPVKSPSPSHRGTPETRKPIPPPFKEISETYRSLSGAELQTRVVYTGGVETVYEPWEVQVCTVV